MTNAMQFGWIPHDQRNRLQHEAHEAAVSEMPAFRIFGSWSQSAERYPLWRAFDAIGQPRHYVHQQTGSCVGAAAGSMINTLQAVESAAGGPEAEGYKICFWPYHYGEGRELAGMRGKGDGSLGSSQAKAIQTVGTLAFDYSEHLPKFQFRDNWLVLSSRTEYRWSDGEDIPRELNEAGRKHICKTVSPVRTTDDAFAALANGYPLTLASSFGTRTIRRSGTPPVMIAVYDDSWAHQMFVDDAWDHPDLGRIFRIGNNWGPNAHPQPADDSPAGGFFVERHTLQRILDHRWTECYAFSGHNGFEAREPEIVDCVSIFGG